MASQLRAALIAFRSSGRALVVVAAAHTLGVFALALVIIAGAATFSPERAYPVLSIASALLVVASAPRPSSESQSPIYTITTSAGGRDPYTWPFSRDSIWNLPIGANAAYVPGNIVRASQMAMFDEADVLSYPLTRPSTASTGVFE